jgi:iron(III) transport system substrate-binding protein
VIAYDKTKVKPGDIATYEDLADPRWKGKICTRSSAHVYNLSLMGAMIDHLGEAKAEAWARGVKANLAHDPKGGDTDQLKAVAAGECELALVNTYYWARLARSAKTEDKALVDKVGIVFPNQSTWGTHVNISGAGVLKNAPHRDAAIKFLEYLASDEAQRYFSEGNNEWPAVASVQVANPALAPIAQIKVDLINVAVLGRNQPASQKLYDRVAWK